MKKYLILAALAFALSAPVVAHAQNGMARAETASHDHDMHAKKHHKWKKHERHEMKKREERKERRKEERKEHHRKWKKHERHERMKYKHHERHEDNTPAGNQ